VRSILWHKRVITELRDKVRAICRISLVGLKYIKRNVYLSSVNWSATYVRISTAEMSSLCNDPVIQRFLRRVEKSRDKRCN